jgi:hypothetical protein
VIKVAKGPGETGARCMSLDTSLGGNPNYTRPSCYYGIANTLLVVVR